MAILRIRTFGDPILRQRARDVDRITEVHRRLVSDMFETMRGAPGVGLAAPQVGVMERIFVWEFEEESGVIVNPTIVARSKKTEEGEEGCLSLPGIVGNVERAYEVTVEATDIDGRPVLMEAADWVARIFQHEIDHLDGVLFIDHLGDDERKQALATLRDVALGLPVATARPPMEESF